MWVLWVWLATPASAGTTDLATEVATSAGKLATNKPVTPALLAARDDAASLALVQDPAVVSQFWQVIAGRALKVTGRVQRESGVTHIIAEQIEDISWMLDELLRTRPAEAEESAMLSP